MLHGSDSYLNVVIKNALFLCASTIAKKTSPLFVRFTLASGKPYIEAKYLFSL